eukprot:TRINITY_DN590_c0_g1_i1.p1 TRINITY_DN590_c0_g1~~TRINITY_DN590_c0_g1_i1.p1  ORF type:complete len:656 (-),score=234.16 TRINITY_DN590_c0_g1_i1:175-2142(-)
MSAKKGKMKLSNSTASSNPFRTAPAGVGHVRDRATIKRLQLYKTKPKRDKSGKILHNPLQSSIAKPAHILPNRKYFGPVRVIDQQQLQNFREEMDKTMKNPYEFVLARNKLPMSLINHSSTTSASTMSSKNKQVDILSVESFADTFGPKKTRKKPKLKAFEIEEVSKEAEELADKYVQEKDRNIKKDEEFRPEKRDQVFEKGTSRRIWGELYKVIDSSDVIIQVLDARDPMGTRSKHIEENLKKDRRHKQLVFVLNKCDLIPTWATARWVRLLSKEYPTLAFHASITNPFGKGSLIQLLRQFSQLHKDKKQISVGFIGYPNVGKSSIINTLKAKKVCKVAPIPGETKVWQYVTLMRSIFLIDCPGVVYPTGDSDTELVLKGVVRVENIPTPEDHIETILERIKKEYVQNTYGISSWENAADFLSQLARRSGRLLKGSEPDVTAVAKTVLHDFQRGKIPYFVCPPFEDAEETTSTVESEQTEEAEEESENQPHIDQIFSNIRVPNEYQADEPEQLKKSKKAPKKVKDEDVTDWDELYQNAKDENGDDTIDDDKEEVASDDNNEEVDEEQEENDEEEEIVPPKAPRNKRKKSDEDEEQEAEEEANVFDDSDEDVPLVSNPIPVAKKIKTENPVSFVKEETESPGKKEKVRSTGMTAY